MTESKMPLLNSQQMLDMGLNVFGLQLFLESVCDKKDVDSFKPFSFVCRGVKISLEPLFRSQDMIS